MQLIDDEIEWNGGSAGSFWLGKEVFIPGSPPWRVVLDLMNRLCKQIFRYVVGQECLRLNINQTPQVKKLRWSASMIVRWSWAYHQTCCWVEWDGYEEGKRVYFESERRGLVGIVIVERAIIVQTLKWINEFAAASLNWRTGHATSDLLPNFLCQAATSPSLTSHPTRIKSTSFCQHLSTED